MTVGRAGRASCRSRAGSAGQCRVKVGPVPPKSNPNTTLTEECGSRVSARLFRAGFYRSKINAGLGRAGPSPALWLSLIVGAKPDATINERSLFEITSAKQIVIPESDDIIVAKIREMGMAYYLSKKLPRVIADNLEQCLIETFGPLGIDDWNKLFYVVHPGGPSILRRIEEKLGLGNHKLRASWDVLSEYGNMWSPSVLFVLDEMRKNPTQEATTAAMPEGLGWGVLLVFGPGLTVETVVLGSFALGSA